MVKRSLTLEAFRHSSTHRNRPFARARAQARRRTFGRRACELRDERVVAILDVNAAAVLRWQDSVDQFHQLARGGIGERRMR